jgi:16S rRNA processing protein RimM
VAEDWVVVAHLTRWRGNKGEICAVPLTDQPGRLESLKTVYVGGNRYEVERVWYHKEQPIFKFRGVDSITEAEKLGGLDVCIPASDRPALPEGEYYFSDLMGCRVVDDVSGDELGTIDGWHETGGPVLLEVEDGKRGHPLLIPFAGSILKKIDLAGREVRVQLPDGLRDL